MNDLREQIREEHPVRHYIFREVKEYNEYVLIIPMVHAISWEEVRKDCVDLFKPSVHLKYERDGYVESNGIKYIKYRYMGVIIE